MSGASSTVFGGDIQMIRENFDTSNPIIADVLKAKEERMKILVEMNRQHEEEMAGIDDLTSNKFKKERKSTVTKRRRKSEPCLPVGGVRRSTRLQSLPQKKEKNLLKPESPKREIIRPPIKYGSIPGIIVGTRWETRMECSRFGVHRPTVAGIHGGPDGAYSIALSGGYPEDVDEGYTFLYTGAGGRDLKGSSTKPKNLRTAPQTKNQELVGPNLSLVRNIETGNPVRVIRGYKSSSIFAPETGYRYDGLYQVVKFWEDVGATGFKIYRFKMERIKDQAPPPWETYRRVCPIIETSPNASLKKETDAKMTVKEEMDPEMTIKEEMDPEMTIKEEMDPEITVKEEMDSEIFPERENTEPECENNSNECPCFYHSEIKENIPPNTGLVSLDIHLNFARVRELENQIAMCIRFFFDVSGPNNNRNLDSDDDEEFHGWECEED